jgi:CRP-like cAMP-binding protein
MQNSNPQSLQGNKLLALMPREDWQFLSEHLEDVDLPLRMKLEIGHKPIEFAYFIGAGFASVVANGVKSRPIEVGVIGREGMTGMAIVMGTDRSPHETFIQAAGKGQRISVSKLRQRLDDSEGLRRTLLRYGHVLGIQTAQTALSNGRDKLEERLARWLLMAQDRIDGDELPLTHEFLAMMLGVRRPGVTISLNLLEKQGVIQSTRGVIVIVDRTGLEECANGSYGTPEAEFRRLFG